MRAAKGVHPGDRSRKPPGFFFVYVQVNMINEDALQVIATFLRIRHEADVLLALLLGSSSEAKVSHELPLQGACFESVLPAELRKTICHDGLCGNDEEVGEGHALADLLVQIRDCEADEATWQALVVVVFKVNASITATSRCSIRGVSEIHEVVPSCPDNASI
eukprot:CAMPEP_0117487508 /NCGR_PEP_ID=MMETSP0784-20121206/16032_1 /TAXON_ID=39447 /ORGANISM="" /LENGTH=162 /DNA_ID=CAMNT_0005282159 /DNA_START=81 /DNA_END=566 /DNA_ORIENTATION=-